MKAKIALLATLLTFAGSVAGFAAVSAVGGDGAALSAGPLPSGPAENVLVEPDRDCPRKARAADA